MCRYVLRPVPSSRWLLHSTQMLSSLLDVFAHGYKNNTAFTVSNTECLATVTILMHRVGYSLVSCSVQFSEGFLKDRFLVSDCDGEWNVIEGSRKSPFT